MTKKAKADNVSAIAQTNGKASQDIEITTAVEIITPNMAKSYLATMPENQRTASQVFVDKYARDMKAGNFGIGAPIQFNDQGQMFDGQHRMLAVVKSAVPTQFLVIRGMPSESMSAVDIGNTRGTKDIANVMGIKGPQNIHFAVANIMGFEADKPVTMNRARGLSHQEKIQRYLDYQDSIDFAVTTIGAKRLVAYAPILMAVAKAYYHENHERLFEFLEVINSGYAKGQEDYAAIALRNAYLQAKGQKVTNAGSVRFEFYQKALSAIKAFCERQTRKSIRPTAREIYPLPEID